MEKISALIVGNLTMDELDSGVLTLGGPGYYGGRALAEFLGADVYLFTALSQELRNVAVSTLGSYGISIVSKIARGCPIFVIRGGKAVAFKGVSPKISANDLLAFLQRNPFNVVILSPVMREVEVTEGLSIIREIHAVKGMDLQGFVRFVRNGNLITEWRQQLVELMTNVDVVHGNLTEYCFSSELEKVLGAVRELSSCSKSLYLISLDERGLYIALQGDVIYVPPTLPSPPVSDVGAGDVLLAVTSYFMAKGKSPLEAALLGASAAIMKVCNAYGKWFDENSLLWLSRKLAEHIDEGVQTQ